MKRMKKIMAVLTMISVLTMGFTTFAAEPTGIGFEQKGLTCQMKLGEPAEYWTASYEFVIDVSSYVTILSDEIIAPNQMFQAKEGYEWRKVTLQIMTENESTWYWGICPANCFEDYYDIVFHDQTSIFDESTNHSTYSVVKDGVIYPNCEYYFVYNEWINNEADMTMSQIREYYFCIPVGYDGTVIGFYNAFSTWEDGMYIYDIADSDTIFYRLK